MKDDQQVQQRQEESLVTIQEVPCQTEILTFACAIPSNMNFVPNDPDYPRNVPVPCQSIADSRIQTQQSQGIVGTILILGDTTVFIWFGWGDLVQINKTRGTVHQSLVDTAVATTSAATTTTHEPTITKSVGSGAFSIIIKSTSFAFTLFYYCICIMPYV